MTATLSRNIFSAAELRAFFSSPQRAKALAFLRCFVHLLGGYQNRRFNIGLPCPVPASEVAATLTLLGKSTIAKTSVSPKAKYDASSLPPADLKNCSAACRRLVPPSLVSPVIPSLVKDTRIRNLDI